MVLDLLILLIGDHIQGNLFVENIAKQYYVNNTTGIEKHLLRCANIKLKTKCLFCVHVYYFSFEDIRCEKQYRDMFNCIFKYWYIQFHSKKCRRLSENHFFIDSCFVTD